MEKSAEGAKLQHYDFPSLICKQAEIYSSEGRKIDLMNFLCVYLHRNEKNQDFWYVCKVIFVLPHGQTSIERGFSVNEDLLVENLNQQTRIGQRKVYDYFSSLVIDIHEYEIPPGLTKSCKSA